MDIESQIRYGPNSLLFDSEEASKGKLTPLDWTRGVTDDSDIYGHRGNVLVRHNCHLLAQIDPAFSLHHFLHLLRRPLLPRVSRDLIISARQSQHVLVERQDQPLRNES